MHSRYNPQYTAQSALTRVHTIILLGVIFVILVVAGVGSLTFARLDLQPIHPGMITQKYVSIPCPASIGTTTKVLDKVGIIKNSFWFSVYGSLRSNQHPFHCGLFLLSPGMAASEVATVLQGQSTVLGKALKVTFPEGLTAYDMGNILQTKLPSQTQTMYLASERTYPINTGVFGERPAGASLEGFLYPDTYDLTQKSTVADVITEQLRAFQVTVDPHLAPIKGLTAYQVLVLASIVQAETKFPQDQPIAAGVFFNRLAAGMPLQSDVTVEYGLTGHLGAPPSSGFTAPSPYNTYLNIGLPPTPIDNPGLPAIEAVLHPTTTSYLYFVADPEGHLHYSETLAEHNAQIQEYCGSLCS